MLSNPYVRAVLGGLVAGLGTAGPLVDNGVTPSEVIAIALATIIGTGLTATPSGQRVVAEELATVGRDDGDYVGKHEAGQTDLLTVLLVVLVVVVILALIGVL